MAGTRATYWSHASPRRLPTILPLDGQLTGGMAVAFSDASEPVQTGRRLAAHLKDRLRPLASALPQWSGLPSWARGMGVLKHHGFSPATVFDIGVGEVAFRFLELEQQVHQVVVAQLQQTGQNGHVGVTEVMLISAEETLEDQIVFQQAAPRAPTKACAAYGVGLMR